MPTRKLSHACAIALSALIGVALPARAAEPTARELIERLPVFNTTDESIQSLDISGIYQHDGKITGSFRILYRAPDRFAYLMCDDLGVPTLFAAGNGTLLYDPVRPQFLKLSSMGGQATMAVVNGKAEFNFGKLERTLLDFKSLLEASDFPRSPEPQVVSLGEHRYLLIRKAGKEYRRATLDLSKPSPLVAYEESPTARGAPTMCIDKFIVNAPLDDALLTFPTDDQLSAIMHVETVTAKSWALQGRQVHHGQYDLESVRAMFTAGSAGLVHP